MRTSSVLIEKTRYVHAEEKPMANPAATFRDSHRVRDSYLGLEVLIQGYGCYIQVFGFREMYKSL